MDADDEFGDLYTDVLVSSAPASAAAPSYASPSPAANPNFNSTSVDYVQDDEDVLYGIPNPKSVHSLEKPAAPPRVPATSDSSEGRGSDGPRAPLLGEIHPLKPPGDEITEKIDGSGLKPDGRETDEEIVQDFGGDYVREMKSDDFPGLSSRGLAGKVFPASGDPGAAVRGGPEKEDATSEGDCDSDSEDDLQIVLNDQTDQIGVNLERHQEIASEDEDEDGDDLVIVAGDGEHIPHQVVEEREVGDETAQVPVESERKEAAEAAKVIGVVPGAIGGRLGYSNHGYYPHHSQFKYVRPGVASIPGTGNNAAGAPGQVRPIVNLATVPGRGRGDWRPLAGKAPTAVQKGFHTGFGLSAWTNHSAGRGFGSGAEFTLPSHKTVFDIEIDVIEDKTWRHPGVDTSDYFNFGLDEDSWKNYCKQLEQLRLEATMQSKIRVYESGRSDQEYDPDLPPELAAAAGLHEVSAENPPSGKMDTGQADAMGHARGSARIRPPIPTGRAIQVEGGYGERLPSIDTRPPRYRDSDAIIEIVLQGSGDDDPVEGEDAQGRLQNELDETDYGGEGQEVGNTKQSDVEEFGSSPQPYDGRRQGMFMQDNFVAPLQGNVNGGESFPPEGSLQYSTGGRGRPFGAPGSSHGGRWSQGTVGRGRDPPVHASPSRNVHPAENAEINKSARSSEENSEDSQDLKQGKEVSSPLVDTVRSKDSSDVEEADNNADTVVSSGEAEGDVALDLQIPIEASDDGSPADSARRQKLSPRIEQPVGQDLSEDLKTNRSDSSKAKRANSKDHVKRHEVDDEEVAQNGRPSHMGDVKRHYSEDEAGLQRRDDYARGSRHDMDRGRLGSKGREDIHYRGSNDPYLSRDWDGNSSYHARTKNEGYDRLKERDVLAWQRREDDLHARRQREEDSRRRDRVEDAPLKLRSRAYESGRNSKEEHIQFQKRLEDGDWRGYHDKEGNRSRERDVLSMGQRDTIDDVHAKRRKEVEHHRRDRLQKEDTKHVYGGKEDPHRRRDRDDSSEMHRREDLARIRDKPDDLHNVKHRDGSRRQRDHEDHHRVKPSPEETHGNWERESRVPGRSRQALEDQAWLGSSITDKHAKDESRDSDKDHKRHHSEQPKIRDKLEEESYLQHRGRHDLHVRGNHLSGEDRSLRHEKLRAQNSNFASSESHHVYKERNKDSLRRGKESEGSDREIRAPTTADKHGKAAAGKIKLEDRSTPQRHEKVARKSTPMHKNDNRLRNEQEIGRQGHSSKSQKHSDEGGSDDESERKGRSKRERWMSHKDKDAIPAATGNSDLSHALMTEQGSRKEDSKKTEAAEKMEDNAAVPKEFAANNAARISEHGHADNDANGDDKHLETVAKLKKRSERFKQPMPNEKEASRKVEHEASTQMEASDVKSERPARKRRWVNN